MTAARRWTLALPWLALVLAGLLAAWLRYGVIEYAVLAQQCTGTAQPMWCALRQLLVLGFLGGGYGYAALVVLAGALLWRSRTSAWLAAALGLIALQLYCYETGAFALLAGCLLLLRRQAHALAMTAPGAQDRPGQRQVQAKP